ncbi:hypothetical protein AYJ54_06045 [Bradyrhizobium centrolobii]|uniref:Uncharacterized protein n=1 Tax=Bradyrhizobium centrolobii TaxID=1505087 RepID=A0A176Z038_9BRAD|nr:hypothetical protein AYJ54_06045 [Bradyrhizobium centrolobii]
MSIEIDKPAAQVVGESIEPAPPAVASSDYSRVHKQLLPTSRGPELSLSYGRVGRTRFGNAFCREYGGVTSRIRQETRDNFGVRRDPQIAPRWSLGWRAIGYSIRHLAERKVLSKFSGRKAFSGTFQQSEEGATDRVRSQGAARKVNRDFRAGECFGQVGTIDVGRTQQDGDTIKRDAVAGERQNPARNLDALAPFARR